MRERDNKRELRPRSLLLPTVLEPEGGELKNEVYALVRLLPGTVEP
jgi:hypothetical protein